MKKLPRRSNLMVPVTSPELSSWLWWSRGGRAVGGDGGKDPLPDKADADAWQHIPDAVTLDLEAGVPGNRKGEARGLAKQAIPLASQGAAEVFVRPNLPYLQADLEAAVWPGLSGVMLPKVESAEQVAEASKLVEGLERSRGIEVGSLELIPLLASPIGVWNVRGIVTASPRVAQIALAESDMCVNLGIFPTEGYDPFVYARGRMIVEATAAGVQPLGIGHPLASRPAIVPRDKLYEMATTGRNLGFKGIICPHPSWVEPVNTAFTPASDLVEYYTQVREVFAGAVAAGTAAVPLAGRMIDVPVDEWAKVVLEMAASCRARDEEKRRAFATEAQG